MILNNKFFKGSIAFFVVIFSQSLVAYSFKKISVVTGHRAVSRSLLDGLRRLGIPFNSNPQSSYDAGDVVVVTANIGALQKAIEWKKAGLIKLLIAGPNLLDWPTECNSILCSPYIDAVIVPCEHRCRAFVDLKPCLKNSIYSWYSGVDPDAWIPGAYRSESNDVLLYWKAMIWSKPESFYREIEDVVRKHGWNPIRINYGSYSVNQYREILSRSRFALFMSMSESQGIALAEAWAMDVPTLCWNPYEPFNYQNISVLYSSCPYLTQYTGAEWKNIQELDELLSALDKKFLQFSPREWVLDNMTDELSVLNLLDLIQSL